MTLEAIVDKLGARRNGSQWMAKCPAHQDKRASLSITVKDGRILLHCHAGCDFATVIKAAGLKAADLYTNKNPKRKGTPTEKIVAVYDYVDESGTLLYQKVRYEPKTFKFRRPNGEGGWIYNMEGMKRVLYRLNEIAVSAAVLVLEGEKDVDTARKFGTPATTGGSASDEWLESYTETLRGKEAYIIADADEPGRKKAGKITAALFGKATRVHLLEMPGSKDLTEWAERGGTKEQLLELCNSAPQWKPRTIDGARLLADVSLFVRRFVALSPAQQAVVALWIVHTHAFAAAEATPYLAVNSAEKRSGKTRLLEVLDMLVANPWLTGRVTAAVLVRKVDAEAPTLLLDESDTAFGAEKEYAEALRGVLNTGYRRGGTSSCCVGQGANITYQDFSTFGAKAIAGIGRLPDTVADRSISIRLKRARRDEHLERFRRRDAEREATALREMLVEWSAQHLEQLSIARPVLPDALDDRQQDVSEPLLAITDIAGGDWPYKAREAIVALCGEADDESLGVRLLADIHVIFEERAVDRMSSADLADTLAAIETSPWSEWSKGKPITTPKLARLLGRFGIYPGTIRADGGKTPKGYYRDDFADSWARYLPQTPLSKRHNVTTRINIDENADFKPPHGTPSGGSENAQIPNKDAACGGVAFSNPIPGRGEGCDPIGGDEPKRTKGEL